MPHDNQLDELSSFVNRAETQRTRQNTHAVQEFMDNHPQIAEITLGMTEEVKNKLIFYMSNADQDKQYEIQEELRELRRHIEGLSEKPNLLHTLVAEEIQISYLFLRHADTMYARHQSNISSLTLRRMDAAQTRFLRALRTLASIHQKLPQFINVNLGSQQIAMTR